MRKQQHFSWLPFIFSLRIPADCAGSSFPFWIPVPGIRQAHEQSPSGSCSENTAYRSASVPLPPEFPVFLPENPVQCFFLPIFFFPTKESLKKEVEMKVTHLVKNMMDTNWDQLLLKYQHQRSSLVPNINRIQVEETSKRFLEAGIKPEELFYKSKLYL